MQAHIVQDDSALTATWRFCQCNIESFGIDIHFSGKMQTTGESPVQRSKITEIQLAIVPELSI